MKKIKKKDLKTKNFKNANKIKFINPIKNLLSIRKLYVKDAYKRSLFNIRQLKLKLGVQSVKKKFFFKLYFRRLDIFLYNLGLFSSLYSVRQFILHKKIYINGQVITQQNYLLKSGDVLWFKDVLNKKVNITDNLLKINYNSNSYEINYKIFSVVILSTYLNSFDFIQKLVLYNWLIKKI